MTGVQCTLGWESEETPRFYLGEGTAVSIHLSCAWSQCSSRSGKIIVRFVVPAMDDFRRHYKTPACSEQFERQSHSPSTRKGRDWQ
jgi:hypothetical protein